MRLYLNKTVEVKLTQQQCSEFGLKWDREVPQTLKGKIVRYYYDPNLKQVVYDIQIEGSSTTIVVEEKQIVDDSIIHYYGGHTI